jgi:hypothetical protein
LSSGTLLLLWHLVVDFGVCVKHFELLFAATSSTFLQYDTGEVVEVGIASEAVSSGERS